MAKKLDSSEIFKQENYRGRIREVELRGSPFSDTILSHILEEVGRKGLKPMNLVIVNVVSGAPERNEPVEAILCESPEGRGLIVKNYLNAKTQEYRFYPPKNWSYIP